MDIVKMIIKSSISGKINDFLENDLFIPLLTPCIIFLYSV